MKKNSDYLRSRIKEFCADEHIYKTLFFSAYLHTRDPEDAEDVLQEVFMELWKKAQKGTLYLLDPPYDVYSVKRRIYYRALDYQRKKQRQRAIFPKKVEEVLEAPAPPLVESDILDKVDEYVTSKVPFTKKEKQLWELLLSYEKLSEIAEVLNATYRSVKQQVYMLRKKLKKHTSVKEVLENV